MEKQFIPYKYVLILLKKGIIIKEPVMYYTHGSTNIMPGVLMKNKVSMAYNMTENQVSAFYVPAILWQEAFDFLLLKTDSEIKYVIDYQVRIKILEKLIKLLE